MDFSVSSCLSRIRKGFWRRISSLSDWSEEKLRNPLAKKVWIFRKRCLGAIFVGTAIWLGVWANEVSQLEAKMKWEKTHLPTEQILDFALGSRGMKQVRDLKLLQRATYTLPARLDELGAVWLSEGANWLAFFTGSEENTQVKIYCQPCTMQPRIWQPKGVGWRGLELALQEIDRRIGERQGVTPKKRIERDPREIVF